jgi:hypothetical protein
VFGGHEERVRAAGVVAGQLEHLRSLCREHPAVAGHGRGGRIQAVEVSAGDVQWLLVLPRVGLLDVQRVADSDVEQGAPGVVGLERGEPLRDLADRVHPQVEDAGGGDDGRRRLE